MLSKFFFKVSFVIQISISLSLMFFIGPSWATSYCYDEMNRLTIAYYDDSCLGTCNCQDSCADLSCRWIQYKYDNIWNLTDKIVHLPNYTVNSTVVGGGNISPATSTVLPGSSLTLSITPLSCYSVRTVIVDGVSKGPISTYSFNNILANHTVNAAFTGATYNITKAAGPGGSITDFYDSSNPQVVDCKRDLTLNIIPNTGHYINNVTVDGISSGVISRYVFSAVTADHIIGADFGIYQYAVTLNASTGGTITPNVTTMNYGSSQVFTFASAAGYALGPVTVDGISQGTISSYTLSNVTSSHAISASFIPNTVKNVRTGLSYQTIQNAYNAANTGDTLKLQALSFNENFNANLPISITIDGGYTNDFTSNPGSTSVIGMPHISNGNVNLRNIHIHY